jgi:DNA-binding transcriptional LysR family regulator
MLFIEMMEANMYSRALRNFLSVADACNISTAADSLHVSQPALTKSIQKLELEVGSKLFTRDSKGVQLTKAGEILLHHARVMENEYRHAQERIAELSGTARGCLRVGAGPIWLVKILPSVVAQFQQSHPNVRVSLVGGVIDTLVPAVVSGELDVICVSLDFPERAELTKVPLFNINHIVVVDPRHPLAAERDIKAADLCCQRWLTLKSDYVGTHRISAFFAANGLEPPKISLETTSIYNLLETLRCGNYIAHIPEQMLELAQEKGLVKVDLNGTLWQTSAGIVIRQSVEASTALSGFIEIVTAAVKS